MAFTEDEKAVSTFFSGFECTDAVDDARLCCIVIRLTPRVVGIGYQRDCAEQEVKPVNHAFHHAIRGLKVRFKVLSVKMKKSAIMKNQWK